MFSMEKHCIQPPSVKKDVLIISFVTVTCRTQKTKHLFFTFAFSACRRLWECVLHSSGEAQNGVCLRVEDGEGGLGDAG